MKRLILTACTLTAIYTAKAQDFKATLAEAKTNYNAGKLAEARFSMQQMMQQIDEKAGQEVLKAYPAELAGFKASDAGNVNGSSASFGVNIIRSYKIGDKEIEIRTITNSPLVPSINAMLGASAFLGGADQKLVRISGYKALLQKSSSDTGYNYQLQIPMGNTLISLEGENGVTDTELIAAAQKLPLADINNLLQ
jgi:hypothetical protein